jgi:hypothetical protein
LHYDNGLPAVCDIWKFDEAIAKTTFMIFHCEKYSNGLANEAMHVAEAALYAAHYIDGRDGHQLPGWCENKALVHAILTRAVGDFLSDKWMQHVDCDE